MSRETGPVLPDTGMAGKIADYRTSGYIGRGTMAVVYLAQDERTDRTVALKILGPELAQDAAFRSRFLHESRAAAAVDHPNIVPVYEVGDAGGNLFVAMRYVQGGDARALLNRMGPLPFGWAWSIIAQVASALDAAHAHGLIHRDVKPTNMLLETGDPAGGGARRPADSTDFDHVYLSDFGISKNPPPGDSAAALDQIVGTPDYVAPEQVEGRAVDGRADLYSLACTGFELLCGTPPFGQDQGLTVMYAQLYAPPPMASGRRPDLPPAVDQVLATALAKNPADRYMTCGQFAEELHSALRLGSGGQDVPAGPAWPGLVGPGGYEPAPPTAPYEVVSPAPSYDAGAPDASYDASHLVASPEGSYDPSLPTVRGPFEPAMLAEPTPYEAAPPAEPPPGPASYEPAAHFEPATGQYEPPAQFEPATGQYEPPAHFEPATGQYEPAAGQYEPATGQYEPATGQYDPAASYEHSQAGWPPAAQEQPPAQQDWAAPRSMNGPGWTSAGPASPQQWAGQGRPGGPKQRPPRQPISRTRLIAAVAGTVIVVVAVAIAAALSLSKHNSPSSSAPHGTSSTRASSTASAGVASRQAAAVNTLLASGAATRRSLTVPIRMATNCRHLPRDAASIRRVVNQRSAEFRNVQALSTGAMAKGGLVKADLLSALRNSLAADRAYLTWVRQQMTSGCTPTSQSSAYQAAQTADGQADAAKRSFVQVWNSVAARYRLPQKSPGDI